jgi:nucleotide-binding universal stress UspA family protein
MSSPTVASGVVVGVDRSAASETALRWAAREAKLHNIPLTLAYVLPAETFSAVEFVFASPSAHLEQQESEARKVIADALAIVRDVIGADGPAVNGEIHRGSTVPTLVELSKEARLLVAGSHGQGAFGRTLLGSVSTGLVHHAQCPVAVIRDYDPKSASSDKRPVVVGIDGSPASELATAIAFDEASRRGVDLIALHAWSDATLFPLPTAQWSDLRTDADATLAERLAGFRERYPDVTVKRQLMQEHPARHLCELSESAQLVVVGSRGRGGFAGMVLGSVSTAVVHGARTPVIVARQN